jgi:hypothetical protein
LLVAGVGAIRDRSLACRPRTRVGARACGAWGLRWLGQERMAGRGALGAAVTRADSRYQGVGAGHGWCNVKGAGAREGASGDGGACEAWRRCAGGRG